MMNQQPRWQQREARSRQERLSEVCRRIHGSLQRDFAQALYQRGLLTLLGDDVALDAVYSDPTLFYAMPV